MTSREWATFGLTVTFLVSMLALAFWAQPTHAEAVRIGPTTQISMADICPN